MANSRDLFHRVLETDAILAQGFQDRIFEPTHHSLLNGVDVVDASTTRKDECRSYDTTPDKESSIKIGYTKNKIERIE